MGKKKGLLIIARGVTVISASAAVKISSSKLLLLLLWSASLWLLTSAVRCITRSTVCGTLLSTSLFVCLFSANNYPCICVSFSLSLSLSLYLINLSLSMSVLTETRVFYIFIPPLLLILHYWWGGVERLINSLSSSYKQMQLLQMCFLFSHTLFCYPISILYYIILYYIVCVCVC